MTANKKALRNDDVPPRKGAAHRLAATAEGAQPHNQERLTAHRKCFSGTNQKVPGAPHVGGASGSLPQRGDEASSEDP